MHAARCTAPSHKCIICGTACGHVYLRAKLVLEIEWWRWCVCVRAATRSGYSTAKSLSAYSIQYINTICWYVAHFNDGYKWLWKQILQKLSQRATSQRTNNSILKYSMLLWLLHLSIRMIQIIAVRARTFAHINGENQWMDDAVNYFRKIYIEMAVWIYLLCAQ